MTHQPLTKAEREELQSFAADRMNVSEYSSSLIYRALADLDAAEAERDALRQIAEGCCNATDGGCSPGVSIEFLRDVPSEVEHIKRERDRLRKMPQSAFEAATFRELNAMEAQRDALKAKLAALVEAASEFYEATFTDLESCLTSEDIVLRGNLGDAIAAARGGAS